MISSAAVQINHCWTMLGRIEMPNSILVPAWKSLNSNIWNVKPILQSLMVFFFCWKICLHLNLSSISAIMSMQRDFWILIVPVPFSPHTDEEIVTHVNEVPISAGSFGIRERTNRGWGYRRGKAISFRWFNKKSAVCIATGIAMLDYILLIEIVVPSV